MDFVVHDLAGRHTVARAVNKTLKTLLEARAVATKLAHGHPGCNLAGVVCGGVVA